MTAILRRYGWDVVVEFTFSHYGERGSIDIVAWHPVARVLLVVEVKTRIYDVQALVSGVDRKARLAGQVLARERAWSPTTVARLVVVPELAANRSLVDRHRSVFEAAFPARSREVRTWLRHPNGPLSGLWFLSSTNHIGGIQVDVGRQRVRVRGAGSRAMRGSRTTNQVGK